MQQYAALGAGGIGIPSAATAAPSTDSSTLGAAATQAASLGANQAWWTQLAVQDYLARAQAAASTAATTPQAPPTSASAQMPNYEQLLAAAAAAAGKPAAAQPAAPTTADSLRLPSDTEIIKYTSSSTGPKVPGTTNRGRKKTISLDPSPAVAAVLAATAAAAGGSSSPAVHPAIPPGLTIERKKTASGGSGGSSGGRKSSLSGDMVDRVEITKIPASGSAAAAAPKDFVMPRSTDDSVSITTMSSLAAAAAATGGATGGDGPLNLSLKPTAAPASASAITDYLTRAVAGASGSQIPTEYYACECILFSKIETSD